MKRIRGTLRRHPLAVITFILIIVAWEIAAHLMPESRFSGSPLLPSWEFIFTDALKGVSNHWTFDFLAPRPAFGGEQTYLGAFLALGYHSLLTLSRLVVGLGGGLVTGIGIGLIASYWLLFRRLTWTPMNFLRMVPLLAAVPLFQFWLGANTLGTTVFVAFGVFVVLVVATMNAIANVPDRYIESARTLGASRLGTYMTVIVPAALPELRTTLVLAVGLSWSTEIGAEYIGVSDGLGSILIVAEFFTNTGQMMVIALVLIAYSLVSFLVIDRLLGRVLSWMPTIGGRSESIGGFDVEGVEPTVRSA